MSSYDYDFFVIGAGSGGVRAARMAAGFGAKVAVAENRYLGGTCVNVGCVPKKLMVYASQFATEVKQAAGYGWQPLSPDFDWHTLKQNKDREIRRLNGVYENLLHNAGVTILAGEASFIDAHRLTVSGQEYSARYILIATGGWPFVPEFPGNDLVMTSNDFFAMEALPKSVVVVGGGYIAVELAGIMNGLGSEVDLLYRRDLFLRGFDLSLREHAKTEIAKKGIKLHFNTDVVCIEKQAQGLQLTLKDGQTMSTQAVLYATGRNPLTRGLNVQNAGLTVQASGAIEVNEHYQTGVEHIYAVGDVIDRVALTPVALAEGMCVANHLFNQNTYKVDYDSIPSAVFSQPNIATVGITEDEARAKYGDADIDIYESSFKPMKYSLGDAHERTYMKLIVQKSSDKVLAAHMLGPDAGEIIQGIAVALKAGATKSVFDQTIGIHPTAAEEFVTMRQPAR